MTDDQHEKISAYMVILEGHCYEGVGDLCACTESRLEEYPVD